MAKYAFVDVQNTDTTTKKLLDFKINWQKFFIFLRDEWKCEKVFLYTGVDEGDVDTVKMLEQLTDLGCMVRAKTVFAYKNKDRDLEIACPQCKKKFIEHIDMGYNRKSNCDVDLTVDAMELAGNGNTFYLFTGDGDFEYLARVLNKKETKVYFVSSGKKIPSGPRYFISRFSTKLRKLIASSHGMVDFLNIDNFRFKISE